MSCLDSSLLRFPKEADRDPVMDDIPFGCGGPSVVAMLNAEVSNCVVIRDHSFSDRDRTEAFATVT